MTTRQDRHYEEALSCPLVQLDPAWAKLHVSTQRYGISLQLNNIRFTMQLEKLKDQSPQTARTTVLCPGLAAARHPSSFALRAFTISTRSTRLSL